MLYAASHSYVWIRKRKNWLRPYAGCKTLPLWRIENTWAYNCVLGLEGPALISSRVQLHVTQNPISCTARSASMSIVSVYLKREDFEKLPHQYERSDLLTWNLIYTFLSTLYGMQKPYQNYTRISKLHNTQCFTIKYICVFQESRSKDLPPQYKGSDLMTWNLMNAFLLPI